MDARDWIAAQHRQLIANASDDWRAAYSAGVEMDYSHEMTATGGKITATTRQPCDVVRDGDRVTVYVGSRLHAST